MKSLLILILFIFINSLAFGQATQDSISNLQESTLNKLRDFKITVNKSLKGKSADTLNRQTMKFIDFAKTSKNLSQLRNISEYFTKANLILDKNPANEKALTVAHLNRDLSFKMASASEGISLNLSPNANLFENIKVVVSVFINGSKQNSGQYTVYWAPYQDASQANIIDKNSPWGSSELFSNPYQLTIKLPGNITFWLKEATSGKIYKSTDESYLMTKEAIRIDRNFIPFIK